MRAEQVSELWDAASDPRIWELAYGPDSLEAMKAYVEEALADFTEAYVIRLAGNGRLIGSTRLKRIDASHRSCELGNSWLVPEFWRTGANRESKLLLLAHAFEELGMCRVELRAGAQNWRSRESLQQLGATEEATLRSIQILPNGERRDHVVFSVLLPEWDGVKARLMGSRVEP